MQRVAGALFLVWTGVLLTTYYAVQPPRLPGMVAGLTGTIWTLLVAAILLFNARGAGKRVLRWLRPERPDPIEDLLLGTGLGLGLLSLVALLLAVLQQVTPGLLISIQAVLALFYIIRGDIVSLRAELALLGARLRLALDRYGFFTKLVLVSVPALSFLLTLVPPFEAFDALLYHLALPERILQHGGLQAMNVPPFWFPGLTQHVYLWALGMGSERAPQVIHFAWGMLAALLLWHWCSELWGLEVARKALLLLAAMPSLPLVASWAYADMALCYYSIAALYVLARDRPPSSAGEVGLTGLLAGFAMGIKYTSFVLPLACGLLLLFHRPLSRALRSAVTFTMTALGAASPWYLRNAVFMENPFYPFLFGGRYWDEYLTRWYADAGTGIGVDLGKILLLPLHTLWGTHDATFFDGRMGPLFLVLAPLTVGVFLSRTARDSAEGRALRAIAVFAVLSGAAWTLGVISSSALWQARFLFPVLFLLSIPSALAWDGITTSRRAGWNVSALLSTLIATVIGLTLLDTAVFVLQRNPLAVALGAQSHADYVKRINPSYAALTGLLTELPASAQVYSLFEPRSYGLPRPTQPDALLYNFAYDAHRYPNARAIVQHWKAEQYTHVLVYERGLQFVIESSPGRFPPHVQRQLEDTLAQLHLIAKTPDEMYSLYAIP